MAGPADFINPIVNAMLKVQEGQREGQQLILSARKSKEDERQNKEQEQERRDQLKQQADIAAQAHDVAQGHLTLAQEQLKQEQRRFGFENLLKTIKEGGLPPEQLSPAGIGITSGGQPAGQVIDPFTKEAYDRSTFAGLTPENQIKLAGEHAQAIAQGQQNVLEPAKIREQAAAQEAETRRQLQINAANNVQAAARLQDTLAQKEESNRRDNETRLQMHQLMLEAKMPVNDPDAVLAAYKAVIGGKAALTAFPKDTKAGVVALAGQRGTQLPTNQVQHSKALDTLGGVDQLLSDYTDLAQNYSRDAKEGSRGYFLTGGKSVPGTDLRAKVDALKATGGTLASYYDQQNRKSDAEIIRQFTGLFDPRQTVAQNLDKVKQHTKLLQKTLKGTMSGINPEDVKSILEERDIKNLGLGDGTEPAAAAEDEKKYFQNKATGHMMYSTDGNKTFYDAFTNEKLGGIQ